MPRWVVELNNQHNNLPPELRNAATIRQENGKEVWEYRDRFNALKAARLLGVQAQPHQS